MSYTPSPLFAPPTYLRKKPLHVADQTPQPQNAEAPAHEELRQQQPQPQRQSMPGQMRSYGKALLQRAQSAPHAQNLVQSDASPQDPPPSHLDESEFKRPASRHDQQNLPDPAENIIPANTTPFRPKDTPPDYLRRLTEVGQPQGTLSKFLQLRPGPFSAATPPSYATPDAAQTPAPTAEQPQPHAAAPAPVKDKGIETRAAAQFENARNAGAVIEDGQMIPHPDGQGGLLHHTGFALTSLREHTEAGTSIPYRDDHGRQHQIPVQDMRRITDPSGITSYHFMVDGNPVSVPEGATPIFQIDKDGKRYTQSPDGTRRDLGDDPNAAPQKIFDPHGQAASDAGEQKLADAKVREFDLIGDAVQRRVEKEHGGGVFDEYLPPDLAEQLHLRDANTLFLQHEYPNVPVEDLQRNYNAYRDDYVRRNYDLPDGVDDKTFHHLNSQKMEQRSRVDGAAGAGVSSAITSGQKLQSMSEWMKAHPNAGEDEQAAWHRTYDQVTSIIDPYRSVVHKALEGGEHEQDVLLDTLANLPESHRELLMRYAATVAKQRGENHMLGVAGTVGASAQRTLTDMFTSVSRIPPSLKTQVEDGQTSFKGPITSVDQALEALSADLQDPRHNYYKRVQQADNLPLRPLSDEEKSIMAQALQRESKRNGLALTMRSILNEAEPLNDTVLGKMAAGLGSSLPLALAATPQGMLAAGAGYANADFHEIMAQHPEMDEAAASKVALVSGAVKAGLDKLSLFGLGKLAPNVAKVLSGQASSQMVKKAALQAVGTNVFENIQEGLQDLTRPAVQSLAASLDKDIHGVDWDREMKQFWGSRLDVALGVLPLTLLGIGHNTLQSRQSVLEILNNDKTLKLAGLAENDRADILKAAQAGDEAKSQALLQEAWRRRDPAVAASAIQETDGAQAAAAQSLKEQKSGASDQSPPPANNGQPSQSTSSDQQSPRSLPTPEENSKALDGIARLEAKAKTGELSPEEKLELDQHEKNRAATRLHHLEAEQEALSKLNPPRELDSFKAQALKDERAILQRPEPGASSQASSPPQIPDNTTLSTPGSVQPAPEQTPRSLPEAADNSKALDGIARLKEKAEAGELSPEEKRELDQYEKTRAATRVYHLETEQQALGKLNPPRELDRVKAQALEDERAILERPVPGEPPAAPSPPANTIAGPSSDLSAAQADVDSFRDDWNESDKKRLESARKTPPPVDSDFDAESKGAYQPNASGELPYLTEYYKKVGRQKDDLTSLIKSIQNHSATIKGVKNQLPILVEEDNEKGASYEWKRDRAGRIIGHRITHGKSTKKWELLEEFAHYRVKQGWKKAEIKELRKNLRKTRYGEKGEREGISEPAATAEEIIVKQHLLDHSSSLSEIERELLKNQIKQLYRYGLREGY